jgi:hypothetical protein
MDIEKDVAGLCSEKCPPSSSEGNGGIRIKTETVSDVEQEDDPMRTSFPGIKSEHEVSRVSVCPLLGTFHSSSV